MIPVIRRSRREKLPEGAVYIGRPSRWGNPFKLGPDLTRDEMIARYRMYIAEHPELVDQLAAREPKMLACWCAPLPCHGDVLAELLEARSRRTRHA